MGVLRPRSMDLDVGGMQLGTERHGQTCRYIWENMGIEA